MKETLPKDTLIPVLFYERCRKHGAIVQAREHSPLTARGMIQVLVTSDLQLALEDMEGVSAEERRLRAEGEDPLTEEGAARR